MSSSLDLSLGYSFNTKTKNIKALMCYVCKKEFNVKKIEAHIETCKTKWKLETLPAQKDQMP